MAKIKIKVGKRYKTRNGLITTPIQKSNDGTNYRFQATLGPDAGGDRGIHSWLSTGSLISDGYTHRLDLVEELIKSDSNERQTTTH